jgi:hypothetical protein
MKKPLFRSLIAACLILSLNTTAQQWPGHTLYSNGGATAAYLVDTNNVTFHSWTGLTGGTGYSSYLAPGGTLIRSVNVTNGVFMGGGSSGRVQKVDYAGTITWDYTYSSTTFYSHHDHCPLPNGNVLLIAWELKTSADLAAAGGTAALSSIWPDHIVEIKPLTATTGSIVWEWHFWDHLVQNVDNTKANYQTSIVNHPELLNINYMTSKDWTHCNGLDYNPILDQVIISSHNMCEYYIIDHSTTTAEAAGHTGGNGGRGGDFLYRWGNPQVYQASGTKIFNVVHDAHWVPEGHPNAGRTVGFNNQGVSTSSSCADEILPPRSDYNYTINLGSAYTPASYLQRTAGFGYTSNEGSSEQFPNGNLLVCAAIPGKIYEVTSAGVPIYTISTGAKSAQAHRYSDCYINNAAPPQPTVTQAGPTLNSSSAATYQWYMNGNLIAGATSQTYTPTGGGTYVVRTTDANGCVYVYSSGFSILTGMKENNISSNALVISPNPGNGVIDIQLKNINIQKINVSVYDALGRNVFTSRDRTHLDLSALPEGMYNVIVEFNDAKAVSKKVVIVK